MKKERLKKLEGVTHELISNFLFEYIQNLEESFGIINITGIKISPDISYLDVYVSSFKNSDILCKTLADHAHDIQRKLNRTLSLRKNPRIRFRYDKSGEVAQKLSKTINSLEHNNLD